MSAKKYYKLELRTNGGVKRLEIDQPFFTIGRSETLKASVGDCASVSREHLRVEYRGGQIYITDLNSSNGTHLAGQKIQSNVPVLYQGERLYLGVVGNGAEVYMAVHDRAAVVQELAAKLGTRSIVQPAAAPATVITPAVAAVLEVAPAVEPSVSKASMQEAMHLSEQIQLMKLELGGLDAAKSKLNEYVMLIAEHEFRERAIVNHIEELKKKEEAINASILETQMRADQENERVKKIQEELEEWKRIKEADHESLLAHEQMIEEKRVELNARKADLELLVEENNKQQEEVNKQLAHVKKRFALESEQLAAEVKLGRTQMECEWEERRTKKVTLEREIALLSDKVSQIEKNLSELHNEKAKQEESLKQVSNQLERNRVEIVNTTNKKTKLDEEISQLAGKLQQANENAKRIVQEAEVKMEQRRIQNEEELAQGIRDIQAKHAAADLEIQKAKNEWRNEQELLSGKANQDYSAATKRWEEELNVLREKNLQELRFWKAQEDIRMRNLLTKELNDFAQQVAARTLTSFSQERVIAVGTLLSELEEKLKIALGHQAEEKGIYKPNQKTSGKKFWLSAAGMAAGLVLLIFGGIYGPSYLKEKIAGWKVTNQQENAAFMREVREQRERMLALHLEAKTEFQEHYVDNVLYNPGYLAMKQDESIKKEWTLRLSKFFFEELLFDDRKVVDFIPIETALIRELAEIDKVLNNNNFQVNLAQMKNAEQKRVEEMWLLVGGRDNWTKLRKCEADFYAKRMGNDSSRVPAGK